MALAEKVSAAFGIACRAKSDAIEHPALAWRRSGLMAITGRLDGPPLVAPAALTVLADSALAILRRESGSGALPPSGAGLLGERARMMGLSRGGAISANGSARLLDTAGGLVAMNPAREDDWDLMPALVQQPVADWDSLRAAVKGMDRDELVARGRLLGLAIAADRPPSTATEPFTVAAQHAPLGGRSGPPLVVDLSALWAGPLAGSLLAMAGAQVVKVESLARPDGARRGDARFYELLNGMKRECMLDLNAPDGRAELQALIARADIVIEASRPRALRQLGIDAEAEAARGVTWLSITAYGREGDAAEAIGFGDDAAVAGGLTHRMREAWGEPLFAGDAIADPLTGILAALTGWLGWQAGGGRMISLAMADAVAFACRFGAQDAEEAAQWQTMAEADAAPLYPLRI